MISIVGNVISATVLNAIIMILFVNNAQVRGLSVEKGYDDIFFTIHYPMHKYHWIIS